MACGRHGGTAAVDTASGADDAVGGAGGAGDGALSPPSSEPYAASARSDDILTGHARAQKFQDGKRTDTKAH